jgi:hypothetical protein
MPLAFTLLLLGAAAEPPPRVAVLEFQANGARRELAAAAAGMVGNELSRLGVFRVVTAESVSALLSLERQRQLLGAADSAAATDLKDVLGTDYAVKGKVSHLEGDKGSKVTLELELLDVANSRSANSTLETARTETDLMELVPKATLKLMSKLLAGRSGTLLVDCAEGGATLKLDDVVMGVTPATGPMAVPAGPHFLAVEKQGFVTFQKEVRVQPERTVIERAPMVPSTDYVAAYEARASRMRLGAYLTTGLAVAGVAAAAGLQVRAGAVYGDVGTPGTFQYARAKLAAGIESDPQNDYRKSANELKASLDSLGTLTTVAGVVAGAAAVAGTYLWIAGDDPAKYRGLKALELGVAASPAGASLSLGGAF